MWQAERRADILATMLARMSVSASWNADLMSDSVDSECVYAQADIRDSSSHRQLPSVEASMSTSSQGDVPAVHRRRREQSPSHVRLARLQKRTDALRSSHEHAALRSHQGQCSARQS